MSPPADATAAPGGDQVDRAFADFVLACENSSPGARNLEAWLDPLAAADRVRFLERVSLFLSMAASRGTGAAYPESASPTGLERIGRFELVRLLAHKRHSLVWAARDPLLHREVAVKLVLETVDPRTRQRFLREAQTLAQLAHPGLAGVYEAGECPHGAFLVMELLAGGDLAAAPRAGAEQEVARAAQLAEALAWLHSQQLVHRDVKPSNVLLRSDGSAVLGDFGLVRALDRESSLTGPVLGTPAYMPREQALNPARVGPGADVHALAVLLLERLGGTAPYAGSEAGEVFARLVRGEPAFAAPAWTAVPKDLVPTLQACMQAEPTARPSATALAADLRAWLRGQPLRLGVRTLPQRLRQGLWTRRRWLAAGALLAGSTALGRAAYSRWRAPGTLHEAIAWLCEEGDLHSAVDPETGYTEGYTPIATSLLAPAWTARGRRAVARAGALLHALDPADPEVRVARACLALRAEVVDAGDLRRILGELAASPSGMALLALAHWRDLDPADPQGKRQIAAEATRISMHPAAVSPEPRDLFLLALLELVAAECLQVFSAHRHAERTDLEACRGRIERLTQSPSPWRAWGQVLEIVRLRITGHGRDLQAIGARAMQAAEHLPHAFLARYFTAISTERDNRYLITRSLLQLSTDPEYGSRMALAIVMDANLKWSPRLLDQAWITWQEFSRTSPEHRTPFAHELVFTLLIEERREEFVAIVDDLSRRHPRSVDLCLRRLQAASLWGTPELAAVDWELLRESLRLPGRADHAAHCVALAEVRGLPGLPGDVVQAARALVPPPVLDLRALDEGSDRDLILFRDHFSERKLDLRSETYLYPSLEQAARQSRLAALGDCIASPLAPDCWRAHHILTWIRFLLPQMRAECDADRALLACGRAELAIGPLRVVNASSYAGIRECFPAEQRWFEAHRGAASTELGLAHELLMHSQDRPAARRGAAFFVCRLAALLDDGKTLRQAADVLLTEPGQAPGAAKITWLCRHFLGLN